jgi:DNA-binding NtrC family response regulator
MVAARLRVMSKRPYGEDIATMPVPAVGDEEPSRLMLHVIAHGVLRTHPLPAVGELTIGRGVKARIHIDDPSISRCHVVLHVGPQLAIEDAGSANGTRVSGHNLEPRERRPISIGETVEIGSSTLVVLAASHSKTPTIRPRRLLSHDFFETRLEDECAAAELSHRNFSVVRFSVAGAAPPEEIRAVIAEVLGPENPVAAYGPNEYEALLLGLGPEAAHPLCDKLAARLSSRAVELRCGLAAYPRDSRTPEALLDFACRMLRGGATGEGEAIVVRDPAMVKLHHLAARVASGNISVLLLGETGSGKEIFAEVIHRHSPRHDKPLLRLNCAALAENLLESELFGHEKGAFTGAAAAKPGLLEAADGGTVFLDEVGEMPLPLQAKLLRVLQERKVLRVGALKPRPIDVRFVAATNRNLEIEVSRGSFRQDLFYRLAGMTLVIPPLRERPSELEELAQLFLGRAACDLRRAPPRLSPEALKLMQQYMWPGNIRELHNVIQRAVLLCGDESEITVEHLPLEKLSSLFARPAATLADDARPAAASGDDERERIVDALERCAGNQTYAARLLGMARSTLVLKMTAYNLPRPRVKSAKPR